jgi:hypothetical protein
MYSIYIDIYHNYKSLCVIHLIRNEELAQIYWTDDVSDYVVTTKQQLLPVITPSSLASPILPYAQAHFRHIRWRSFSAYMRNTKIWQMSPSVDNEERRRRKKIKCYGTWTKKTVNKRIALWGLLIPKTWASWNVCEIITYCYKKYYSINLIQLREWISQSKGPL